MGNCNKVTRLPPLRILLLGVGGSGKSTIFKQIKILNTDGFNDVESTMMKLHLVKQMLITLMEAAPLHGRDMIKQDLNIAELRKKNPKEMSEEELQVIINADQEIQPLIVQLDGLSKKLNLLDMEQAKLLREICIKLWGKPHIREFHQSTKKAHTMEVYEWLSYFFNRLEIILEPGYVLSQEDMLRVRRETNGVVKMPFVYKGEDFILTDVGGQTHERSAWESEFTDLFSSIFVISLADYDQFYQGKYGGNKLVQSLELMAKTTLHSGLQNVPMVTLLNKSDVFKEKIKVKGLSCVFPECDKAQEHDYDYCLKYIEKKVLEAVSFRKSRTIVYVTNATDTELIRSVFEQLVRAVQSTSIGNAGFSDTVAKDV